MWAENFGLSLPELHRMIALSAGDSWMWRDRGPRMMQAEPPIASAVDIFVKDLGIVLENASNPEALPLSHAAHAMFTAASTQGLGRRDDSQVIITPIMDKPRG
jgi:putative dehydrogenase